MTNQNWKIRFKDFYPRAIEKRIPIDETPNEVVNEIDPLLEYTGKRLGEGYSMGNRLYIVKDSRDGLEKVLKVASAPANISKAIHEHEILKKLNQNNVRGVPQAFRFYNSVDSKYNSEKFTAMLRKYVDAEEFNARLRGNDVYQRINQLVYEINRLGVSIPRDFNGWNVRADNEGQPYILDFEESVLSDKSIYAPKKNYEMLHRLFLSKVGEHLQRSTNPLKRTLSRSPKAVRFIADLII